MTDLNMVSWANLTLDLLAVIAKRLPLEDFIAFSKVCKPWQSVAIIDNCNRKISTPWLMLAAKHCRCTRDFFSPSTDATYRMTLPELKAKRCFSSLGWVFTIGKDLEIAMVNPLSGSIIKLPSMMKFSTFQQDRHIFTPPHMKLIHKFVLSDNPSHCKNYTVMVLYGQGRTAAFWSAGDDVWTKIDHFMLHFSSNFDVIHYRGRFIAICMDGGVVEYDVHRRICRLISMVPDNFASLKDNDWLYVVESAGKLLVVSRQRRLKYFLRIKNAEFDTVGFRIFEINIESDQWKEIKNLADCSLFVGFNSSFCLEIDGNVGNIKSGCIYFTEDDFNNTNEGAGKEMGIYNMEDGTVKPHFPGRSCSRLTPPLWIQPS